MRLLLLAALVVAVAAPARAQLGFVPMAGYDFGPEAPLIGFGFEYGLTPGILPIGLAVRPSVEYVFTDEDQVDLFRVNGDLIGRFGAPGVPISPYGKVGVAAEFLSDDAGSTTEVGGNLGAGIEVNRFFLEGTLGIGDVSKGRVAVGFRF